MICPICKVGDTESHCNNPQCDWWRCTRCNSFGNTERSIDARRDRGRFVPADAALAAIAIVVAYVIGAVLASETLPEEQPLDAPVYFVEDAQR